MFIDGDFTAHSGETLQWKINCDYLVRSDLACLAKRISDKYQFYIVYGVPTGGLRLANELVRYQNKNSDIILIVDDVLTTGKSMNEMRKGFDKNFDEYVQGVVIFSRGLLPVWVDAIFELNPMFN